MVIHSSQLLINLTEYGEINTETCQKTQYSSHNPVNGYTSTFTLFRYVQISQHQASLHGATVAV